MKTRAGKRPLPLTGRARSSFSSTSPPIPNIISFSTMYVFSSAKPVLKNAKVIIESKKKTSDTDRIIWLLFLTSMPPCFLSSRMQIPDAELMLVYIMTFYWW
jgi:hypothetical protein